MAIELDWCASGFSSFLKGEIEKLNHVFENAQEVFITVQ
jgi:hypothetical protein